MPIANIREPEKVLLPSTQDLPEDQQAWVIIDLSTVKAGDIATIDRNMTDGQAGLAVIASRIKEWNYTDSQLQPFPITVDSVGKILHRDDFRHLSNLIDSEQGGLSDEEKKASNPTSPQSVTVEILE